METKICSHCKIEKDIENFAWRNKAKNQRRYQCNSCFSEMKKIHYRKNKEQIKEENKNRRISNIEHFKRWKEQLTCSKCDEHESVCLDFHHLDPNEKEINVSQMVQYHSWESLMEEVNKCIVVCRNCHAKIHAGII